MGNLKSKNKISKDEKEVKSNKPKLVIKKSMFELRIKWKANVNETSELERIHVIITNYNGSVKNIAFDNNYYYTTVVFYRKNSMIGFKDHLKRTEDIKFI